jgi:ABC-type branched-subunit amino acid transport system permease subunit
MENLIAELTPVIVALVSALAAILVNTLNNYVQAKYKDTMFSNITQKLNEVINTVVLKIEQTHVDELKLARLENSPGGARITEDEAKKLAWLAFNTAMGFLGEHGIKELKRVYKFADDEKLAEFVRHKIEAAVLTVHQQKQIFTPVELVEPEREPTAH